ncbi:uncharacterized protein NPIL_386901 [Nephila pilipes]|uniref:Chloride channel CLIC-like protein 1 n=1 Tax=Nephila pilipes TaxID=299642 RepID=A0A8X6Q293_NEPPI|nr:uncharacterized protein NPIL_386901 [Nephila pilipes]
MFYFIIFSFVFLCFIPLSPSQSDVPHEKDDDHSTENHEDFEKEREEITQHFKEYIERQEIAQHLKEYRERQKISQHFMEYKERQEVAHNYMDTLSKVKESWVDPYDMIGYPVLQARQEFPSPAKNEQSEESKYLKFLESMPDQDEDCTVDELTDKLVDNNSKPKPIPPVLDNDEKPIFSDIRGDIIGEKMYTADDSPNNKESKGIFANNRQQISVLDSIYVSRWLKKLILKIEKEAGDEIPGGVHFPMDSVKLNNLRELSTAKSLEISQLDDLMCNLIDGSILIPKEVFDWTVYIDYARDLMWPLILAAITLAFLYGIYQGVVYHPFFTFFICLIILSVFWHWMHLYKQKQAYKHAELASLNIPSRCRKHDFGLIEHVQEYLKSFFITNECAKYYEALMVDPFWEVSFTVAASEALASMLVQPLSSGSRALNLALRQLFEGLSIFIIVPVTVFMFLLLIMMCNYKLRLPFFMGALEPHIPPKGSRIEDVKPSRNPRRLKDAARCKCGSIARGIHPRQDIEQESDPNPGAVDSSRKFRGQRSIQRCLPESDARSEFKSLGRAHGCEDAGLPCESCNLDRSASEDDISIIDSEENDSSSENSVDHQSGEFQHCCMCCLSEEMPNAHADCRVCGDNMEIQNAGEASEMVPEYHEMENNAEEVPAQRTTDHIPNIQLGAGVAANGNIAG